MPKMASGKEFAHSPFVKILETSKHDMLMQLAQEV